MLLLPDLLSRTKEDLLRRAAQELERSGRPREEREETRHALVAAGVGRGDRGGKNAAGDQGYGERDRGRGQPYSYCALTKRSRAAAARTDRYAARRCRYSACRRRLAAAARLCWYAVVIRSIATFGDTACRMFVAAGVVCLFHRGRRLDDVAITITGGDIGPADVQEETAAAGRRRIFLAAHASRT